jgi:ABC-2 type transport system permease protein
MNAAVKSVRLVGYEQKTFWRNPPAAVLMFLLPLALLLILGGTLGGGKQMLLPGALTFGLLMTCYSQIAFAIVQRRDDMFLKRLRATPLRPAHYMSILISNALLLGALVVAVMLVVGTQFQDLTVDWSRWWQIAVLLFCGAASFCALGLAMSALVPNEEASPVLLHGFALPMTFLGCFFTISNTSVVGRIAGVFPTRHLAVALAAMFDSHHSASLPWWDLAVLGFWFAGSILIALWRFRWEPKH